MDKVYVTLQGTIGDYVRPLRTKSYTKSERLINMKQEMNECVIKHSSNKCGVNNMRAFVDEFQEIAQRNTNVLKEVEMKWGVFKEIEEWYGNTIYQFAYGLKRDGVTIDAYQYYKNKLMFGSEKDKIIVAPKIIVCVASLSKSTANYTGRTSSLYQALEEYAKDPEVYINRHNQFSIYEIIDDFENYSNNGFNKLQ